MLEILICTIDLLLIELTLIHFHQMIWLISSETMSCQLLQKVWYKFILEEVHQELKPMNSLLLLHSSTLVKFMEFQLTSLLLLVLTIVTLEIPPALYLSVQLMPIQMDFQLSHGQKLNSHNSNILSHNLNMKMPRKREDALVMLEA